MANLDPVVEIDVSNNTPDKELKDNESSEMEKNDLDTVASAKVETDSNVLSLKNSDEADNNVHLQEQQNIEENGSKNHDPYSYTKLDDFTSEIYKIEINNLPNYVGYGVCIDIFILYLLYCNCNQSYF